MIEPEWPKEIPYRGVVILLTMRFKFAFVDYGYELPGEPQGLGFLTAAAALSGAKAAVDRKLERRQMEREGINHA
jgi:hypothetical protein